MSGHGNQDADYLNGRHLQVCPECGGHGRVTVWSGLSAWPPYARTEPCAACDGTGKVPASIGDTPAPQSTEGSPLVSGDSEANKEKG